MSQATILVVEDETIVAKDIQCTLARLGYRVPATATSGEEALRKAAEIRPDLILMDIVLKGPMDGVETARELRARYAVPVVYLTAYADDYALERAKTTEPAGYLLKPFQTAELRPTIEMALHRSETERQAKESLRWLATTVRLVSDGVITTDCLGHITYMNAEAESFTGWEAGVAVGYPLELLLGRVGGESGCRAGNVAERAVAECRIVPIEDHVFITKSGACCVIQGRVAPVVTEEGAVIGAVVVCRARAAPPVERGRHPSHEVEEIQDCAVSAMRIINLCAWCKRVPDPSGEWYDLHTFITERSGLQFNGGLCPECMDRCFPSVPDRPPRTDQPATGCR
ncbi:MAG TPA: response regulator [Nitrospira sp.]|nr:response regulator [Nitrospira sp.]